MRRAVGGHLLRVAIDDAWTNCGKYWFLVDCMTGVIDMNYTTSVSPCLQVIRLIKLESKKISVILEHKVQAL
jgi:hypothetical protein